MRPQSVRPQLIPLPAIQKRIDEDLAELYGVEPAGW
jgi:hypothetical protein